MPDENMLQLRLRIAARPATVYPFFTDTERFSRWMGQGSSIAPNAGGDLRVAYPNGDVASGRVVQLLPEQRIAFTWGYEGGAHGIAAGSTRVLIALADVSGDTLLTLRHDGFPTEELKRNHAVGWRTALALLANMAAREQFDAAGLAAVEAYLRAWNQHDAAQRAVDLAACWDDTGTYRDHLSYVEGREEFNDHIGAAQALAPNVKIEIAGLIQQCQGALRFPFRVRGDGGLVFATGACFAHLTPEGRIRSMVSFLDGVL